MFGQKNHIFFCLGGRRNNSVLGAKKHHIQAACWVFSVASGGKMGVGQAGSLRPYKQRRSGIIRLPFQGPTSWTSKYLMSFPRYYLCPAVPFTTLTNQGQAPPFYSLAPMSLLPSSTSTWPYFKCSPLCSPITQIHPFFHVLGAQAIHSFD